MLSKKNKGPSAVWTTIRYFFSQRSASWKEKQPHTWNLRDGSAFFQQRKCLIYHLTKQFFRLPDTSFQLLLVFRIGELCISLFWLWKKSTYIKKAEHYQKKRTPAAGFVTTPWIIWKWNWVERGVKRLAALSGFLLLNSLTLNAR